MPTIISHYRYQHPSQQRRHVRRLGHIESYFYEWQELLGDGFAVFHQGNALSLNISQGGVLLFMDQAPPTHHVLKILLPGAYGNPDPQLMEVCWTQSLPIEDFDRRYLVGGRFL